MAGAGEKVADPEARPLEVVQSGVKLQQIKVSIVRISLNKAIKELFVARKELVRPQKSAQKSRLYFVVPSKRMWLAI